MLLAACEQFLGKNEEEIQQVVYFQNGNIRSIIINQIVLKGGFGNPRRSSKSNHGINDS